MKKILKLLAIYIPIILLVTNSNVYAAPARIYPNEFNVVVNNISKSDIKIINVLYCVNSYQFNVNPNEDYNFDVNWPTDRYNEYAIEHLNIDINDKEWIATDGGKWLDSNKLDGKTIFSENDLHSYIKCMTYKDVSYLNYFENKLAFSIYNLNENNKSSPIYIGGFYLEIERANNEVIFSNYFTADIVIDEFSSGKEISNAEKTASKTAYFAGRFSKDDNKITIELIKISDEKPTNIVNKNNNSNVIIFIIALSLAVICLTGAIIIFIKRLKTKNKLLQLADATNDPIENTQSEPKTEEPNSQAQHPPK